VQGKKSLDVLSLAADGIDLEKYQKEGNGYERLTIKRRSVRPTKTKPSDDDRP
jgi:hypothetical protein